jgi:hypothetical protein
LTEIVLVQTRRLLSLALAAASVLAGCSGSRPAGGGPALLPPAPAGAAAPARRRTTATLRIKIPKKIAPGRGRGARFVSPSTLSATIAIAPSAGCASCSAGFTDNIGLTAASPQCASSSTGTLCTFAFDLKPGSYTGSMSTYDGALKSGAPTGSVLSLDQSFPLDVVAGKANVAAVSLYGVPGSITCLPVTGALLSIASFAGICSSAVFLVASGATSKFAVYALDVDGNLMLGPGAPAISAADPGFTTAVNGNVVSLTPPAMTANLSQLTIALSSPACQQTGAACSFLELLGFDSLVAIADTGTNTVALFSRLQIQSGAAAPIATVSNGISGPDAVAFDANGNLFVANGTGNTIAEYAPPYTGNPIRTLSQNLNAPYAIAIDETGDYVAALNGGSSTAEIFKLSPGAHYEAPLSYTDATALAFDSQANLWISFYTENSVERFPLAFNFAAVDTLLDHASNGITKPVAVLLDSSDDLFVGEGKIDKFHSPYGGMPSNSSTAMSGLSAMAIDGTHGEIAACTASETAFFKTGDLSTMSFHGATSRCLMAFDRMHDLETVFSSPASAMTLYYDSASGLWNPGRAFASTALSNPMAVATWP